MMQLAAVEVEEVCRLQFLVSGNSTDFSKGLRARVRDGRPSKWVYIPVGIYAQDLLRLFSQRNREKLPDTSRILGNPALCRNTRAVVANVVECVQGVSGTMYCIQAVGSSLSEISVGVQNRYRSRRTDDDEKASRFVAHRSRLVNRTRGDTNYTCHFKRECVELLRSCVSSRGRRKRKLRRRYINFNGIPSEAKLLRHVRDENRTKSVVIDIRPLWFRGCRCHRHYYHRLCCPGCSRSRVINEGKEA